MRPSKPCRKLTGVEALYASEISVEASALVFHARARVGTSPRCGCCGRHGPRYDRGDERNWRHFSVGETVLWLRYAPWRVACRCCGVTVEQVPWARRNRRFTVGLDKWIAYLVAFMDRAAITRLVRTCK